MLGNHNRKDSLSKAGAGRLCSQPGGGGVRGEGVAQSPVTFLTHFRIPSLPLLFLLHPGRLRGHPRSEEPAASTPQATAGGVHQQSGSAGDWEGAGPATIPGFPCAAPPWSHGLASTCWRPQPPAEPLPPPPAKPPAGGDGNSAPFPFCTLCFAPGGHGGRRAKPAQPFSFTKCKSATAAQRLGGRDRPPSIPPPSRRSGEVGCARPQPAYSGNLGSSRAPRGMLPRLGGGQGR